jgi:hypothetical protein
MHGLIRGAEPRNTLGLRRLTGLPANTISGCDLILGFRGADEYRDQRNEGVSRRSQGGLEFVSETKCPGTANALLLKGNVAASELE